jgi:hypothetical protein
MPSLAGLQQLAIFTGHALSNIQHQQDHIGLSQGLIRFTNPDALGFIERLTDPRGIDKLYWNSPDRDRLSNKIARSARHGGYDRSLTLHQPVEQAGFAYIWPSHNREREPFMHDASISERLAQLFQRFFHSVDALTDLVARQNRNIIFREVNSSLHHCDEVH